MTSFNLFINLPSTTINTVSNRKGDPSLAVQTFNAQRRKKNNKFCEHFAKQNFLKHH